MLMNILTSSYKNRYGKCKNKKSKDIIMKKSDRNRMIEVIVETQNKERLRNTKDKGHKYSIICSCGNCHNADIIAEALIDRKSVV